MQKEAPTEAAAVTKFLEMDRKAKSLLVSLISDEYLGCVREKTTSKDMWKALEETFAKKSAGKQTVIRKQIARLRLQEGSSLRNHLLQFEDLIRQLRVAGSKLEESDVCSALSLTLPESFDPIVTALENLPEDELTYELMKTRLQGEESKRMDRMQSYEEKPAVFLGNNKKPGNRKHNGKCHACGQKGHFKKDCRMNKADANVASGSKSVVFMANGDTTEQKNPRKLEFLLDSGASEHLVNSRQYFSSVEDLKHKVIINCLHSRRITSDRVRQNRESEKSRLETGRCLSGG